MTEKQVSFNSISLFFGIILFSFLGWFTGGVFGYSTTSLLASAFLSIIILWFSIRANKKFRVFVIFGSLFIGYIIYSLNSALIHDYTHNKCYNLIERKNGAPIGSFPDVEGKNSYYKSWYQHLECEERIKPFFGFKDPVISDNPSGFIPKN